MKSSLILIALSAITCVSGHAHEAGSSHARPANRRHHVKRASSARCAVSKNTKPKKHSSTSKSRPAKGSSASRDPFSANDYLSINGIAVGFLPDNGDSGGTRQSILELNEYLGHKSFSVGLYAHVQAGVPFDGSELTDIGASQLQGHSGLQPGTVSRSSVKYVKDGLFKEVVESGATFIASVMPTSWDGLTKDNNTQAVRIAKVMKRFTDAGVVSWLRFAHEANWYNSDSCNEGPSNGKVYPGTEQDVKDAWAVMSAARDQYAPEVKMYWSPNTGSQQEIESYAPEDTSTIDIVGVDWYPSDSSQDLPAQYQWMHDKYASATVPFTIGETGSTKDLSQRQALLTTWTSADTASKMPHFKNINWFNYVKGADFMLGGKACGDCQEEEVRSFFSNLASTST